MVVHAKYRHDAIFSADNFKKTQKIVDISRYFDVILNMLTFFLDILTCFSTGSSCSYAAALVVMRQH